MKLNRMFCGDNTHELTNTWTRPNEQKNIYKALSIPVPTGTMVDFDAVSKRSNNSLYPTWRYRIYT